MAMSRDGLLPPQMQKVHPKYRTPYVATIITGVIAAFFAGVFPIDVLGELVSIGILLAFTAVCAGVLVLRRTMPDAPRPFRVPFASFTCTAGVIVCLGLTLVPAARHVDPAARAGRWSASPSTSATGTGTAGFESRQGAEAARGDVRPVCIRPGVARQGRRARAPMEGFTASRPGAHRPRVGASLRPGPSV